MSAKKEGIPKYLTANEEASDEFYRNNILYCREMMSEKKILNTMQKAIIIA